MYETQPKKLIIMNILDILRRYTDADHRLSQKEIAEILDITETTSRTQLSRARVWLQNRIKETENDRRRK